MASKIKVGDTVRVIAGADKNNEGKVVSIDHKNNRVVVEGVNLVKKQLTQRVKFQHMKTLLKN